MGNMNVVLDYTCTLQFVIQRFGLALLFCIGVTCLDDAGAWASGGAWDIHICNSISTRFWAGRLTRAASKSTSMALCADTH